MVPSHENLEYPRRLLMNSPFHDLKTTLQVPSPSPHPSLESSSTEDSFSSNLTMIVMMLLCALICSFCMNCFIKCVFKCINTTNQSPNFDINTTTKVCGLDKRALKTFPVVKYSKEVKIQGLATECVICIQEYVEGEKVRILPKCNHGFHVKCIDKWLSSHTTCPTCRQSLSDTCQKIIGCENQVISTSTTIVVVGCDNHVSSSSTTVGANEDEDISVNIAPLEREV